MTSKQCIENGNFNESYKKWKVANKRWKDHWFETCVEIFSKSKKWAKEFIIDPITKTITKIDNIVKKALKLNSPIVWNCEQIDYPIGTELFYLIKGIKEDGTVLFSKVGTTTRTVNQRMSEHLKAYYDLGIRKIEVDRVYDCKGVPAECYESWFRAKYIMKYPNTFQKNDRFFGVIFDLENADKMFAEVGA